MSVDALSGVGEAARPRRFRKPLVVAVVAVTVACVGGGFYASGRHTAAPPYSPQSVGMRAEIVSGDYRSIEAALDRWAPEHQWYASRPDSYTEEELEGRAPPGQAAIRLRWTVPPQPADPERRGRWEIMVRDKRSDSLVQMEPEIADGLPDETDDREGPLTRGWNGWLSEALPEKYPWLSAAEEKPATDESVWISPEPESTSLTPDPTLTGPLVLHATLLDGVVDDGDPHDYIDVVLAFISHEPQHVHWATVVPELRPQK